jgi:hypothetical protein
LQETVHGLLASRFVKRLIVARSVVGTESLKHPNQVVQVLCLIAAEPLVLEFERPALRIASAVAMCQHQSKATQMATLSSLTFEARELVGFFLDLAHRERQNLRQIHVGVGAIVQLQVAVDRIDTIRLVPVPELATDFDPQQASYRVLKAPEVPGMHAVNNEVVNQHAGGPQDG